MVHTSPHGKRFESGIPVMGECTGGSNNVESLKSLWTFSISLCISLYSSSNSSKNISSFCKTKNYIIFFHNFVYK